MLIDKTLAELFALAQRDYLLIRENLRTAYVYAQRGCIYIGAEISVPIAKRREEDITVLFKYSNDNLKNQNKPPEVYLRSHREAWKNLGDTHIEKDWRICLFPKGLSFINYRNNGSIRRLLETVVSFLCREYNYQMQLKNTPETAKWPGKEFAHGQSGILEAQKVRKKMGSSIMCHCGSNVSANKCKECY